MLADSFRTPSARLLLESIPSLVMCIFHPLCWRIRKMRLIRTIFRPSSGTLRSVRYGCFPNEAQIYISMHSQGTSQGMLRWPSGSPEDLAQLPLSAPWPKMAHAMSTNMPTIQFPTPTLWTRTPISCILINLSKLGFRTPRFTTALTISLPLIHRYLLSRRWMLTMAISRLRIRLPSTASGRIKVRVIRLVRRWMLHDRSGIFCRVGSRSEFTIYWLECFPLTLRLASRSIGLATVESISGATL